MEYKWEILIGGAGGYLAAQVAMNNTHMKCISFDLPPVESVATENINMMNLSDRVSIQSGDFLKEDLPKSDVITMEMFYMIGVLKIKKC